MIDKSIILPFYAKATIFLIGLLDLFTILYIAQSIILPIVFAIIVAIVLHPVVNFLVQKKINRIVSILITLLFTFLLIIAFVVLLFSQARRFAESWPILVNKFTIALNQAITWASGYFDTDPQNFHDWITKTKGELINTISDSAGQTLITIGSKIVVMLIIPIYVFLILFYQPLLLDFIHKLFGKNNQSYVSEVITQTKALVQHYIIGLLFEAVIVAILYSTGLLIIGIDYAILLGCMAALLNIIPYIGGFIAVSLFMIIAIATKDSATYPLLVLLLYLFIHLIDNSFIIPKIVASKVKINALISITAIIASFALLGIPGMIICIPVTGILKLIFDHIEPLKPWGFLLGDTMPPLIKLKIKKATVESLRQRLSFYDLVNHKGLCARSHIYTTLKNPVYIGKIKHKGELFEGTFPPIVSNEIFEAVQARMSQTSRPRKSKNKHDFPFTELLKCGECGCSITAQFVKGHGGLYRYYRCTKKKEACSQGYLQEH